MCPVILTWAVFAQNPKKLGKKSSMNPSPPTTRPTATSSSSSSRHGQLMANNVLGSTIASSTTATTATISATTTTSNPTKTAGFSRHKKPTLDEVVESVFHSVTGDYGDAHGFDVPANFYDFYDDPLFRHFLACIVYYYFGFVDVRKLEQRILAHRLEEGQPPLATTSASSASTAAAALESSEFTAATANTPQHADANQRELLFSQVELRRRLRLVGEAYSRLLLNCSNFEHTSEDKRFFEFVFEFTRSVTRLAVDKKYWDEMEQSLSYLFRGYMFNNPTLRSKATKVLLKDGGEEVDDDAGNFDKPTTSGGRSSIDKGGMEPIDLARRTLAKYRSRVTGAPRARGIRAQRRMRKKMLSEATSNDFATGLLPPEVASVFGTGRSACSGLDGRRNMSSVREIINARSPLVSMLLPTPVEASANARMMKIVQRRRSIGGDNGGVKGKDEAANHKKSQKMIQSSNKSDQTRRAVMPKVGRREKHQSHRKRGAALFDQ